MNEDDESEAPRHERLDEELHSELLSFLKEVDGEFEAVDMLGLVEFIVRHGRTHPWLHTLLKINEDALIDLYRRTGEVPPGVVIYESSEGPRAGTLAVRAIHGPIPPKK